VEEGEPRHISSTSPSSRRPRRWHYEISGYGTSRAVAEAIGNKEVMKLLKTTEDEEGATVFPFAAIQFRANFLDLEHG
jgi:hypothetical protein